MEADLVGFSLVVHVASWGEIEILKDWFEFLAIAPRQVVALVGEDTRISPSLSELSQSLGAEHLELGVCGPKEFFTNEYSYLRRQVEAASEQHVLVIKLDTFPMRTVRDDWLEETFVQVKESGAKFLTGSALPFRDDWEIGVNHLRATRRVSNNFMLFDRQWWLSVQDHQGSEMRTDDRFIPERALEEYCAETGDFGIRCLNSKEWRVFHTNAWGERGQEVRRRFRNGEMLDRYLKGYQDDKYYPWERFYLHPKPPLSRRARIWLGAKRRKLMSAFKSEVR